MPVYQYQGKHYELSETDPAQALAKIKGHLGEAEPAHDSDFMKIMKEYGHTALEALGALPQFGGKPVESEGLKGPVEAVAHGATAAGGFLAGLGLSVPAAINDPSQSIPEHAARISDNLTYEPKTELGQDLSKPIDEAFYRLQGLVGHGTPDLPQGSHAEAGPRAKLEDTLPTMRNQKLVVGKPKGFDVNQFAAEQQGVKPSAKPFDGLGERQVDPYSVDRGGVVPTNGEAVRLSNDGLQQPIRSPEVNMPPEEPNSFGNMAQTLQDRSARQGQEADVNAFWQNADMQQQAQQMAAARQQASAQLQEGRVANAGSGVMDEMAGQLRAGEQSPVTPMGRPPMESTAMDLTARPPQQALDARQAALEQQVAQRQSLDFNAAERARQEAAPVPGMAEDQARQGQAQQVQVAQAEAVKKAQEEQAAKAAEAQRVAQEQQRAGAQTEAQKALERRQTDLEFQVKKQQTADFNAAERARQENAPIRGMDNAHVGAFKDFQTRLAEAEQHPDVVAAVDKARQAEELYTRVADGMQNGLQKPNYAILSRVQQEMEHFQQVAQDTRGEVALQENNPLKNKPISSAGPMGRQRGAVDIGPLKDAVDKTLELVKKLAGELPPIRSMFDSIGKSMDPQVISTTRKVLKSEGADPKVLDALDQALVAAHKLKLGQTENQVNPLRQISPGGRQSGAILLESNKKKALENLATKIGIEGKLGEIADSQWTPEQAVQKAKEASDVDQNMVQKFMNNFTKGGLYQALKTHNPMIRYVVEKIQEADRLSRALTNDWVHGRLAPAMRAISSKEQAEVWHAIEVADMSQRPLDYEAMAKAGASEAQIKLAQEIRAGLDFGYDQINRARAAAGKDPIDKRVAYAAMRASGDFRRVVYDSAGEDKVPVGVIASNYRNRVNGLKGEMESKGYFVGEERYFATSARDRNSSNQAFMSAVEHLADSDPRVAQFVDILDQLRTSEVYSYLNTKKHTMEKKGVFGMEGRKPWMDPEQNAADGLKSQMAYMEATIKWGNISEAAKAIKPLLDDPDIKMPVAKEWSERYLKNALGFNPSAVGAHLEGAISEAFKNTGVGYSVFRKGMSTARQVTNGLLLMLNPRFWLTNVVQPMQGMPGMKAMLIARGLDHGFDFGTGYSYLAQAADTMMRKNAGGKLEPWEAEARDYARKYHVYGSDMVEHSDSIRNDVSHYAQKTSNFMAGSIESVTRQLAFYSFVHMLKENGMSVENGLHTAAHNLTDMMMNNYSSIDRPSIYHALGPVGDLAVNLQSYKHNELSRLALFARQAQEYGSVRPVVAHLASGLAFGGILGTLAYDKADQVYHMITKLMGAPDSLTNRVLHMSEGVGAKIKNATGVDAPYLVSHGVFSMFGMDMTRSLGLTDPIGSSLADIAAPGFSKLGEIAKGGYDMATNPSEMNAKRLTRAASPIGFQGAIDNQWFTKPNGLSIKPRDLTGQGYKNDVDKGLRYAGLSGVHEAVQKQKTFNIERESRDYSDLRDGALNTIRDQMYSGQVKGAAVQKYLDARGDPKTLENDLRKYAQNQNMSAEELNLMHSVMSRSIAQRLKALEYVKMFGGSNANK